MYEPCIEKPSNSNRKQCNRCHKLQRGWGVLFLFPYKMMYMHVYKLYNKIYMCCVCVYKYMFFFFLEPSENDYMVTESIVILSTFKGWNWAKQNFLNNFVKPSLIKYAKAAENQRAFSILCELYGKFFQGSQIVPFSPGRSVFFFTLGAISSVL